MARNLMEFNVDDFDASDFKSMYIEASAGTGKTYTIENLVGKLVEWLPVGKNSYCHLH